MLARRLMAVTQPAPTVSFVTSASATGLGSSSNTFSGLSLGAADTWRWIVVAVSTFESGATTARVDSVTVAGVSARNIAEVTSNGGTRTAIWIASVPSGTTGDVVLTVSAALGARAVAIYRLISRSGNIAASQSVRGTSVSINMPHLGCAVACSQNLNGSNPAWTNATKDYGVDINTNEWASSASVTGSGTSNPSLSIQNSSTDALSAVTFGA